LSRLWRVTKRRASWNGVLEKDAAKLANTMMMHNRHRSTVHALTLMAIAAALAVPALGQSVADRPRNHVTDLADIVDAGVENELNRYLLELEQKLEEALGMEVKIQDRQGRGKVTIKFSDHKGFDRIFARLMQPVE